MTAKEYWPEAFVIRRPKLPVRLAPATTDTVPLPGVPFQLLRSPDSKPSAKIVSVYPTCGVIKADATDATPVPIAFVAATVNVYAVPFVSAVTV